MKLLSQSWPSALAILGLLTACGVEPRKQANSGQRNSDDAVAELEEHTEEVTTEQLVQEEDIPLRDVIVAFGIRDFNQINETMAVLTGVNPRTATVSNAARTIQAVHTDLAAQLPTGNDVKGFLAAHQVASSKLAVEYCNVLASNATVSGTVLPGFNIAAAPNVALNATGREQLAMALMDRFWATGLSDLPERDATKTEVVQLIGELLTGRSATDPAATRAAVTGACTSVLISSPAMFL